MAAMRVNAALTQRGIETQRIQLDAILGQKKVNTLLRQLILKYAPKIGPPKTVNMYRVENKTGRPADELIIYPRGMITKLHRAFNITNHLIPQYERTRRGIVLSGDLFDHQRITTDYMMKKYFTPENIAQGTSSCILNMGAGLGKTVTAAAIIAGIGLRTLYIAKDDFLQKQAIRDLSGVLATAGGGDIKILKLNGGKPVNPVEYDIVVVIINSALMRDENFFCHFGLVIFDEVHCYCGTKRSEIFWKSQAPCMLGMSATTSERTDGFDKIHHLALGDVVKCREIPGFTEAIIDNTFNGTVTSIKYSGPPDKTYVFLNKQGHVDTCKQIQQMCSDSLRDDLIVDRILRLYRNDQRYIFVFSEYRDHLVKLREKTVAKLKETDENSYLEDPMMGGVKNAEEIARTARIIYTTYSYGSTGISIPKMNAVIFATPRRNGYIQTVGRILRRGGDPTIHRVVIDIMDVKVPLKSQFYSRKVAYDSYKFNIVTEKVDHLDIK